MAGLVVPERLELVSAAEYVKDLASLWKKTTREEQREITLLLVKRVLVDISGPGIVAIEPNPAFRLLFTEICEDLGLEIL